MSLSSKRADKVTARHPHFLIYYSFGLDESDPKIMKLHPFGLICSSYPGLQRWIYNNINDQFLHTRFFEDLTKFTEMEREMKTQKILRRHTHIGRDESQFDDFMDMEIDRGVDIIMRKEQIYHNDFFNMQ